MTYLYSKIDKKNRKWFENNLEVASLRKIILEQGKLRGLTNFELEFTYPISVIAGKNGAGKTTILALAACAYHNMEDGFSLSSRKTTYYTFSDFFIQSKEEIPVSGIKILYGILHNNWKKSKTVPKGEGLGYQRRIKPKSGKWNNYNRRVNRDVVFYGVNRIVPHSEKTTSKTYRRKFKKDEEFQFREKVIEIVGFILNRNYDDLWYSRHSNYKLPTVKLKDKTYSGFNMGAGENALFEIFTTIFSAPNGMLLVIDEIELGLHEEAQIKFMQKLKDVCLERKIQIIATTHSQKILESLPPEARIFIERFKDESIITKGISTQYASGLLSGKKCAEILIFVEDNIAKAISDNFIDNKILARVNIIQIGSASAIVRQMSARYRFLDNIEIIAIFDGDKRNEFKNLNRNFLNELESFKNTEEEKVASDWFQERALFLPGDSWPEKYLCEEVLSCEDTLEKISDFFNIENCYLRDFINDGIRSGKHNEFYTINKKTSRDIDILIEIFSKYIVKKNEEAFTTIKNKIEILLNSNVV